MFRIKICGITSADDARAAAEAGADAIGLNFYPGSKRYVTPADAVMVFRALPTGVVKVGVFVNADVEHVCHTYDRLGLDLVQLHGDEPPEFVKQLGDRPVMRAFRLGEEGLEPVGNYLSDCKRLDCMPRLALIDSHVPGEYGGTGATADWKTLARYALDPQTVFVPPLVLAGGLTPENVAEAIRAVGPWAVDTASGAESRPGRKDPTKVAAFVRAAREAFGRGGV